MEERRLLATFLVTSTADDGSAGTLRSAIAEVNGTSGSNTIKFDPTVFHSVQTINLTASQLELSNSSGTQTIIGPAAGVIVSGGNQTRVLEIDKNVTASISGVTFTKGNASGPGGGLYNLGNSTLTNCTLSGNASTADGGGMFNAGTASLTGCTISGNSGRVGGGIGSGGAIALTDCTITQNGSEYSGGGVYITQGTATLTSCTISSNGADGGGGVANQGSVTLADCVIENNIGSGLHNLSNANATLTGCTISGNQAQGGGIATIDGGGVFNSGAVSLSDCTLSDNTARFLGGGFYMIRGTANLTSCTISGNSAQDGGGLQADYGNVSLADCMIGSNAATGGNGGGLENFNSSINVIDCTIGRNTAAGSGGGLCNQGSMDLTACTVSGNSAPSSGGGILDISGAVNLLDTIVAGNTTLQTSLIASDIAGGPAVSGTFNLIGTGGSDGIQNGSSGNIILPSLSTLGLAPLGYYGGPTETMALLPGSAAISKGTFVVGTGLSTDQRGQIVNTKNVDIGAFQIQPSLVVNTASDGLGSAFGDLSLRDLVNLADVLGSAQTITFSLTAFATAQTITLTEGPLDLTDTGGLQTVTAPSAGVTISGGNSSQVWDVASSVTAAISGLTIAGGFSLGDGGGVSNAGSLTLTDCTMTGNAAAVGGALYNDDFLKLINCTISSNSATGQGGGIASAPFSASTLIDCTLSGNTSAATFTAGGVYLVGSTTLDDSIIAGNTNAAGPSDIAGPGTVTGSNNLVGTGGAGSLQNGVSGNLVNVATPLLAPLGNYGGPTQTIALLPGSPAIAAGLALSGISNDQRGTPRSTSSATDIGAFQDQGYTLAVASGAPQSALVNQPFTSPLVVQLTENFDNAPIPGASIAFTAPTTGPSALLSSPTNVTTNNGLASITATANATIGAFQVQASVVGLATPAMLDLTNQVQPQFSVTTPNQSAIYDSPVTISGIIAAGTLVPTGDQVTVTVDNQTLFAPIGVNGAFSVIFNPGQGFLDVTTTPYLVSYSYADHGGYRGANASSQLTINPEQLTITAVAATKYYDGTTNINPVLASPTITPDNLPTYDHPGFSEEFATIGVGADLSITPTGIVNDGNGGSDFLYTYVPVMTGQIKPAEITVTAQTFSKTYDGTNSASAVPVVQINGKTITPISGTYSLFNGDYVTGVTELFESKDALGSGQSVLAINNTYSIVPTADQQNYVINPITAAGSISPAPLTIKLISDSRTYDGTTASKGLPTYTVGNRPANTLYSVDHFVTQPTEAFSSKDPGANGSGTTLVINPYTIADGNGGNDYSVAIQQTTGTIKPAPLVITANDQTKAYGASLPVLTVNYSPFVGSEGPANLTSLPTLSTTATASSPAGTYMISVSGASSPDYSFTFVPGVLTVTPAITGTLTPGAPLATVTSVAIGKIKIGKHKSVQDIVVSFSEALDGSTAQSIQSYALATIAKNKKQKAKAIPLSQATYSPSSFSVTILTRKPLSFSTPLQLTVEGAHLLDGYGRELDGNNTRIPGTNFTAILTKSGATITSARRLQN